MRVTLTPAFVAKAVAQSGAERSIYWDKRLSGFGLVVTASGHRSYCVQYRADGRSRRMTIDGVLGLVGARKRATILLGEVARERDPLQERRKAAARTEDTFQKVALNYLAREGKALRSVGQRRATLVRLVYPRLGMRPIADIRRSDIVKLLDHVEDTRGPAMADTVLAFLRRIMSWHASRSDEFRSPIVRGMARTKSKEQARRRILSDDEIRAVWKAADATPGPFGPLVQFLLLTAARRNEAARMAWSEIDGSVWTLPKLRNKTKEDLVRPLSAAAQGVLNALPKIAGSDLVFTASGVAPISGFHMGKVAIDRSSGITGWRLHDLRRTARSLLSRAGVDADIAERCLGHALAGVRGVYDRHGYVEEMLHAFEALAAQVERIVNPQENVVALARK